ncbi:hypothetical protein QJS10_CPA03g01256 [Acorus calamus]|uniref:Uncharacterized protein n=1 Tax=Acorus calamus TaxID=4465 RepID=A0AAV9F4W3_ACOCL|nr:hypothetical protein QJS10_CPA03g01256 [Acorus calamus]
MDPLRNPNPGKNRLKKTTVNPGIDNKHTKKPLIDCTRRRPKQPLASTNVQKRVFGTSRTSNVTVEKPQSQLPTKIAKPSVKLDTKKGPIREGIRIVSIEAAKIVSKPEKKPGVALNVPKVRVERNVVAENGIRTPTQPVKPGRLSSTPFYSAENCSKCKVRQARVFFILAFSDQPFRSLLRELRRYMARHSYLSSVEMVWRDVCCMYGLIGDGSDASANIPKLSFGSAEKEDMKENLKKCSSKNSNTDEFEDANNRREPLDAVHDGYNKYDGQARSNSPEDSSSMAICYGEMDKESSGEKSKPGIDIVPISTCTSSDLKIGRQGLSELFDAANPEELQRKQLEKEGMTRKPESGWLENKGKTDEQSTT